MEPFEAPSTASATAWTRHAGPAATDRTRRAAEAALPNLWGRLWSEAPSRRALHTRAEGWIVRGQLDDATRRRAGVLGALGVVAGDRVVLSMASSLSLVEWHVGTLRAGAVAVPTNPAYRARELDHVLGDADPRVVVVDDPDRAEWARRAAPQAVVIEPTTRLPSPAEVEVDAAAPGDPAMLPYTSGTTGAPKGALLSHGNLLASVDALLTAWRWSPEDRLLLALPLFHMHGLGVGLHGTLASGGAAILHESFDARRVAEEVASGRTTMFFGVPTMYSRLAALGASELRHLRLCVSGSAPLSTDLFQQIEELSGQRVLERYGMTETLMNLSNPYEGERRPGTVGFPLPGVEVRLAPADGEIELRGPNVFGGYWHRPADTTQAFTDDGWFRTGDLAAVDGDGYYRILGRSKELIISGGFNVHPREVEEVLTEMPPVREAAVVGTPSAEWGEIVTAFIVTDDERAVTAAIDGFCAERLAPYKRPRLVHFVDSLPRNALGKVVRDRLPRDPSS